MYVWLGCSGQTRKQGAILTQGGKDILASRPALGLPLEQKSGIYGQKWGSLRSTRKRKFENNWLGKKKKITKKWKKSRESFKLLKLWLPPILLPLIRYLANRFMYFDVLWLKAANKLKIVFDPFCSFSSIVSVTKSPFVNTLFCEYKCGPAGGSKEQSGQ